MAIQDNQNTQRKSTAKYSNVAPSAVDIFNSKNFDTAKKEIASTFTLANNLAKNYYSSSTKMAKASMDAQTKMAQSYFNYMNKASQSYWTNWVARGKWAIDQVRNYQNGKSGSSSMPNTSSGATKTPTYDTSKLDSSLNDISKSFSSNLGKISTNYSSASSEMTKSASASSEALSDMSGDIAKSAGHARALNKVFSTLITVVGQTVKGFADLWWSTRFNAARKYSDTFQSNYQSIATSQNWNHDQYSEWRSSAQSEINDNYKTITNLNEAVVSLNNVSKQGFLGENAEQKAMTDVLVNKVAPWLDTTSAQNSQMYARFGDNWTKTIAGQATQLKSTEAGSRLLESGSVNELLNSMSDSLNLMSSSEMAKNDSQMMNLVNYLTSDQGGNMSYNDALKSARSAIDVNANLANALNSGDVSKILMAQDQVNGASMAESLANTQATIGNLLSQTSDGLSTSALANALGAQNVMSSHYGSTDAYAKKAGQMASGVQASLNNGPTTADAIGSFEDAVASFEDKLTPQQKKDNERSNEATSASAFLTENIPDWEAKWTIVKNGFKSIIAVLTTMSIGKSLKALISGKGTTKLLSTVAKGVGSGLKSGASFVGKSFKDVFTDTAKGISKGASKVANSSRVTESVAKLKGVGSRAGSRLATSATKIGSKASTFLKGAGGTVLGTGGLIWAGADALRGVAKSKEWGTSKTSSAIGAAVGGTDSGASGALKGAAKGAMIGSFFGPIGTAIGGGIGAIFGGVGGKRIAKGLDTFGKWVGNAGKSISKGISDKWKNVKEGFSEIGKGAKSVGKSVKGWFKGLFSSDDSKSKKSKRAKKQAASHKTGLEMVPYDNYLANLHQGEMVLPASSATNLRSVVGSSTGLTSTNSRSLTSAILKSVVSAPLNALGIKSKANGSVDISKSSLNTSSDNTAVVKAISNASQSINDTLTQLFKQYFSTAKKSTKGTENLA